MQSHTGAPFDCSTCSDCTRKRRHPFEAPEGRVHFFLPIFPSGEQDRSAEGGGSSPRDFSARRPSGRSEAKRLDALLRFVKSSSKMGWTYPCTAVPDCPFLPMRHRVRCHFSLAGDRLRLLTPSQASPWFVTGRPPQAEVYERVPFQGWSVENSPGAKHRLVSSLPADYLG